MRERWSNSEVELRKYVDGMSHALVQSRRSGDDGSSEQASARGREVEGFLTKLARIKMPCYRLRTTCVVRA